MAVRESGNQWYLAQFKPNCAQIAVRNLDRQGFGTFLPLERQTRKKSARYIEVKEPYFPGYLFVEVSSAATPWQAIRSTHGVARLVTFGKSPAPVPVQILMPLIESCDEQGVLQPNAPISKGHRVRISNGPFVDFIGTIEGLQPEQRAWVLLEVMGKDTRVSVPRSDLRLAG